MKYNFECGYCGHRWQETAWNEQALRGIRCPRGNCNERQNLKIREVGGIGSDVFGYRFSPDFPKENINTDYYDNYLKHSD